MLYDPDKVISETRETYFSQFDKNAVSTENVTLLEAQGRQLAVDIKATHAVPPFVRSLVDGYAVGSCDTAFIDEDGPATLSIVGTVMMGEVPTSLPGVKTTFYIPTGGMLPDGADAVVKLEDCTKTGDDKLEIKVSIESGDNMELDGTITANGSIVLEKGVEVGPDEMSILAEFGYTTVPVVKKLVVGIFSSGDELTSIDTDLAQGSIRDTNAYLIAGMVKEAGGDVRLCGIVPDDLDMLVATISKQLESVDIAVMTGGTAVGGRDFTAEAFDLLGKPGVIVNGIKVKGGRPIVLANINGKPVIGLAGYPPGAKSGFQMVVEPLIEFLQG